MKKMKSTPVAKTYRLLREVAPLSFMLASHHNKRTPLLYFDEEKGINRPLRYARNQKSPFEDEQDGNAIMEPIVFEDGFLRVERGNQVLQEFLYYHPHNGSIFEELNPAKEAAEELEIEEMILDAQILAKELDIDKLVMVSRVLFGMAAEKKSTSELKRDVLVYAKNNPQEFLEVIADPDLQIQGKVARFFEEGLLTYRKSNKEVWYNTKTNKTKMLNVPFGSDGNDLVVSYLRSDEGIEVLKHLESLLD